MTFRCIFVAMSIMAAVPYSACANEPSLSTIEDVDRELRKFIAERFPAAKFSRNGDTFIVKVKTMKYIVHSTHRGVVSERTYETEGPRHDGFLLRIEQRNGRYGGPLFVPQTLREPYWNATVNEIVDSRANTYLWVSYQWGRLIDKDFHKELRKRLACDMSFPESITIQNHDAP